MKRKYMTGWVVTRREAALGVTLLLLVAGLILAISARSSDAVTVSPAAKAGCPYAQEVCRILDKAQHIAYDATHGRSEAPYSYTDSEDRTIRNHPGQLGNVIGSNADYNHPGQLLHDNVVIGAKTATTTDGQGHLWHARAEKRGNNCERWHVWTYFPVESILGADLFDYDWYATTCYRMNAAGDNWLVVSGTVSDNIANHSASTVKVQGFDVERNSANESGNHLPNPWWRVRTSHGIDNCAFIQPFCSAGWRPTVDLGVFGPNHAQLYKATLTG